MQNFPFHVGKIFVFGSNLAGRHGAGAALEAKERYGAREGQGMGLVGWSYAIPTKDAQLRTLPLPAIHKSVDIFKVYAWQRPEFQFFVTPIGTGLAGYTHAQIAPFFKNDPPPNCEFVPEWQEFLK